jgi:4-nitrophenyl phosphatase
VVKRYRLYIFDMDGVLYRGREVIPDAIETLHALREGGARILFFTNNSSGTRRHFADKLQRMGFDAHPEDVLATAYGAAHYIKERSLSSPCVYVVGEKGLEEELRGVGAEIVAPGQKAEWVVVGICWQFSYAHLDEAQWQIRQGARFVATNRDAVYPDENGRLRPGAGAMVSAIATASGKEPEAVIGKPETWLVEMALKELDIPIQDVLLVGDRLDTDIECGNRLGCDTALVLTGVTSSAEAQEGTARPSFVLSSLRELLKDVPTG